MMLALAYHFEDLTLPTYDRTNFNKPNRVL